MESNIWQTIPINFLFVHDYVSTASSKKWLDSVSLCPVVQLLFTVIDCCGTNAAACMYVCIYVCHSSTFITVRFFFVAVNHKCLFLRASEVTTHLG